MPDIQWLSSAGDFIRSAGMPGVILALGYVVKVLWGEIKDRDRAIADLQNRRAEDTAAAFERLAIVATTGSGAITANTAATVDNAGRLQGILDISKTVPGEHARILGALDRNADKIDDILSRIAAGMRA